MLEVMLLDLLYNNCILINNLHICREHPITLRPITKISLDFKVRLSSKQPHVLSLVPKKSHIFLFV